MSKQTRSDKKISWRAKAMGALALAAAFGLPAGAALAANTSGTLDDTTIEGQDDYTFTGGYSSASSDVTMSGGKLSMGKLIFGGDATSGATDFQFINSSKLIFKGGQIVVNGDIDLNNTAQFVIQPLQADTSGDTLDNMVTIVLSGDPAAKAAANTISAKTLNYHSNATWGIKNTTIKIENGGTFNAITDTMLKTPSGGGFMAYGSGSSYYQDSVDGAKYWNSHLEMNGGTLNMVASGDRIEFGRIAEFGKVDLNGGIVNVGGYYQQGANIEYRPSILYGNLVGDDYSHFKVNGATVNLESYGGIAAYGQTTAFTMNIMSGTINMKGASAIQSAFIRASSSTTLVETNKGTDPYYSKLNMSGGTINVAATHHGVIFSRETTMTGGLIDVAGSLIMAPALTWMDSDKNMIKGISSVDKKWGHFYLDGGAVNVVGKLLLEEGMVLHGGNGTLNGKLVVTPVTAGSTSAGTGEAVVGTVNVASGKEFTVASLHITQAAAANAITVNGKLTVNGALTTGVTADAASINIAQGGILSAKLAEVLDADYGIDDGDNKGLATALGSSAGQIYLTKGAAFNYEANDMTGAQTALDLAAGQIVFTDGTLVELDADGNEVVASVDVDATVTSGVASVAGAGGSVNNEVTISGTGASSSAPASIEEVTITGTGNLNAKTVTVESSKTVAKVTIQNNLTISGAGNTAGADLVAGSNGDAVEKLVLDNGSLTLGAAGSASAQGGTVGNIDIAGANSATLNVNDGTFNAGAIATPNTTSGAVKIAVANSGDSGANAETTLTTEGIDLSKATGAVKIDLASATLNNTTGDIKIGGTATTADHELTLTGSTLDTGAGNITFGQIGTGDNILALATGSTLGAGEITFGNITTSGNNKLTVDTGSLVAGAIAFGNVTSGDNVFTVADTGAAQNATGGITFGTATANAMTVEGANLAAGGDIIFNSTTGANTLDVAGGTLEVAGDIKGTTATPVQITVGDSTAAGHIVANVVENASIILDPPFGVDSDPTTMVVATANNVDLGVLMNSWFLIDNARDEAWMQDQIAQLPGGKLNDGTGGYTAAMAIRSPMVLGNGKELIMNGTLTETTMPTALGTNIDKATFAANSLLIVDASGLDVNAGEAALTSGKTTGLGAAAVDAGAALKLVNAKMGDTVTILDNFTVTRTGTGWSLNGAGAADDTLLFDSKYLTSGTTTGVTGTGFQVEVAANAGAVATLGDDYPELSDGLVGMLQNFLSAGNLYDPESTNAGIAFVSQLLTQSTIAALGGPEEAARVLEGAARVAVVSGAPAITGNVMAKASTLVVDHNNLLNATQPAYGNEPGGLGLWLTPFYGMSDVDGMDAGQFENAYEVNYGGAALGLDYTLSESFRLGVALNVGGGDSESQGDFNKTESDFDFFGVSLYGSYTNGAFGLTGDVGYTAVDNDIEQNLPAILGANLKSTVDSDAFTVGLTGQYRFAAGENLNVTPHLGLRYTKISTDDADVKSGGAKILGVETEDQTLFQIPLGVTFSSDLATEGGWTITPSADLGVLFTMGDTDIDSTVRVPGTLISGRTNTDAVDSAAFTAALGIQAKSDSGLTLGLEYGLLASGNQTDHSVSGLLRFEF